MASIPTFVITAVVYSDEKCKNIVGFSILDPKTSEKQIISKQALETVMSNNRVNMLNVKLEKTGLKGKGGSLDRYTALDMNGNILPCKHPNAQNKKATPMVILAKLGDAGFKAASYDGKIANLANSTVIEYGLVNGIANGKIITEKNRRFVTPIDGTYPYIPYEPKPVTKAPINSLGGLRDNRQISDTKPKADSNSETLNSQPVHNAEQTKLKRYKSLLTPLQLTVLQSYCQRRNIPENQFESVVKNEEQVLITRKFENNKIIDVIALCKDKNKQMSLMGEYLYSDVHKFFACGLPLLPEMETEFIQYESDSIMMRIASLFEDEYADTIRIVLQSNKKNSPDNFKNRWDFESIEELLKRYITTPSNISNPVSLSIVHRHLIYAERLIYVEKVFERMLSFTRKALSNGGVKQTFITKNDEVYELYNMCKDSLSEETNKIFKTLVYSTGNYGYSNRIENDSVILPADKLSSLFGADSKIESACNEFIMAMVEVWVNKLSSFVR